MERPKSKIGYSEAGGIFIGKNIQSDFHQHRLIAIVLSFSEPFEIVFENDRSDTYEAALIPKDTLYKLSSSEIDFTVFVHLDLYSEIGLMLNHNELGIQKLNRDDFAAALNKVQAWYEGFDNTSQRIENLLRHIVTAATKARTFSPRKIDERILRCIQVIRKAEAGAVQLHELSDEVYLSPSRLSHLFKEETGLTFRQLVQHYKLVKSLQAMHDQKNLTEASFTGGFSDQPHFTKTFKKTFGTKPSSTKE